jgi:hypothetical protein
MVQDSSRIVIYTKDVQRMTGKSEKYCRMLLKKIMDATHKESHQFVSIEDFSEYTGLSLDIVRRQLID